MIKTITANIPARSLKFGAKVQTYAARVKTFTQDDAGQWYHSPLGASEMIRESDVIDECEKATNWPALKAAHFAMHGFHN